MPDTTLLATKGLIFGIQRFSIHDGPGIRTSIFFKGCNLSCVWCHNPEGISGNPALFYLDIKCISCGSCVAVCPAGAHTITDGIHTLNRKMCTVCGKCAAVCPAGALKVTGRLISTEALMQVIRRDIIYYENDGGVTLSGGEALLQANFARALLILCRNEKIHTAVETNGMHAFSTYESVMPWVDLFLFDYKMTDADKLAAYTGADMARVMDNLGKLHNTGARILLRCPIIVGLNDNEEHFQAIAQITKDLPNLAGAEILLYHNLGVAKSVHAGMKQDEFSAPEPDAVKMWKKIVVGYGGRLVNAD